MSARTVLLSVGMYGVTQTQITPMTTSQKPVKVIHDTDLHGFSCGICYMYALARSNIPYTVYSHFSTNPNELRTSPDGLARVVELSQGTDLVIVDIPIDNRNPKAYVDALIGYNAFKGRVMWFDHHGHSEWVGVLTRNGVFAVVVDTSYELNLILPRMYGIDDSYVHKWALLGATSDFDPSIADKVSMEYEITVCDIVDQAFKFRKADLCKVLGVPDSDIATYGNVGAISKRIVERGIEADQFIELCKSLGVQPLEVPPYQVVGNVVYTTTIPKPGTQWKTAWKLCCVSGAKVAIVPGFNPARNEYVLIIAKNWRTPQVTQIIEDFVKMKFAGRMIVGHPGARSVVLTSQQEIDMIPQIAKELNELIETRLYTSRVAHLMNITEIGQAVAHDFNMIYTAIMEMKHEISQKLDKIAEILARGAVAKEKQVELLQELYKRDERTRYD